MTLPIATVWIINVMHTKQLPTTTNIKICNILETRNSFVQYSPKSMLIP